MADRLAKLEKAYRRYPDSPLFARLADLYLSRGEIDEALGICRRGCQHFPDYAAGFLVLAKCHEAQGEVEEAREALDRALRLDPVNPGGYRRLSGIYQKLGVPTLALKSLQQAAELDPFAENLDVEVDQLMYQVRLESARDAKQGEVDPVSGQVVEAIGEMLAADLVEKPPVVEAEDENVEPFGNVQTLPEWDSAPDVSEVLEEFKQGPNPLFAADEEAVEQLPMDSTAAAAPEIGDIAALLGLQEEQGESTPTAKVEEPAEEPSVETLPQVDDGSDMVAAIGLEVMDGDFVAPTEGASEWAHYSASEKEGEAVAEEEEGEVSIFSPDILPEDSEIFQSQEPELPEVAPVVVEEEPVEPEETAESGVDISVASLAPESVAPPSDADGGEMAFDSDAFNEVLSALQADLPTHPNAVQENSAVEDIRAQGAGEEEGDRADGDTLDEVASASALGNAAVEEVVADDVEVAADVAAEDDDVVPPVVSDAAAENGGGAPIDLGPLVEAMSGLTSAQNADSPASPPASTTDGDGLETRVAPDALTDDGDAPESAPAEVEVEEETGSADAAGRGTGFKARGDDELLRIFQEIEGQESEDSPAELASASAGEAEPDLEERRIATATLAEIYTIQGLTQKAIETYRQLLEQEPNNEFIRCKLQEMEKGSGRK